MNPAALNRPIRVLVVDDSALVRRVLGDLLSAQPDIDVVATAPDPYVARDKILALNPDVITLDLEMPRMDGLTFLDRLMRHRPMPVVVVSSIAQPSCAVAVEALRRGAVDVLAKPGGPMSVGDWKSDLAHKIRAAALARVGAPRTQDPPPAAVPVHTAECREAIIAIGASTGGTQAVEVVLRELPAGMPPIVVTQHIPPGFSLAFAQRLDKITALRVREAQDSDMLERGLALIAPGNRHMRVRRAGERFRVHLDDGEKVCYQRPSVDVLFRSVAEAAGANVAAAILTGMGSDGAQGMLDLRRLGAYTVAQDEASCVVFGMPRAAIELGAAQQVAPLQRIAGLLRESRPRKRPAA